MADLKAIPLIMYSSSSRIFDVNPKAIDFLKTLEAPIGIVSVAGRYRTGKSYLLNRVFVNQKHAFSVGPTINPCTKGLWLYPCAIQGRTKDGRPCSVLIIDSEGIGALDEDTDHDTRIFSLAILLSSYFVYNSIGAIDENALSNLSLVVNITKHIHINSSQSSSTEYSEYFPDFMWVVRDFTLRLVDTLNQPIGPKEYLELALQPQKTGENDEKNKIRKHLTSYFLNRDCTTMVRPTESEKDLQNLDSIDLEELRVEFVQQVRVLREKVIFKIKPKSLNGTELNGEMFGNLIDSYVNAMNSGVVPNIQSSWSLVCGLQNKKVTEEAKEVYEKVLGAGKKFPIGAEALKKVHQKAKAAALRHFQEFVVVEEPKLLNELTAFIGMKYQVCKDENLNFSKKEFSGFLKEAYERIEGRFKDGGVNALAEFERCMKSIEKEYESIGTGPFKREGFLEFYKEKLSRLSDILIRSVSNELELHKDITGEHISRVEKELKNASEQLIQEKNTLQKSLSLFQSERSEYQAREKALKDQVSTLMMDREKLENSLKDTTESLKYKNQIEIEKFSSKNSELLETLKETERELQRKRSESEEEKALTAQKIKILENTVEEYKQKEKTLSSKLKDLKSDSSSTNKSQQLKYESLISKLQEKLASKGQDYKDLEAECDQKDVIIEELKQNLTDNHLSNSSEKSEMTSIIESLQRKLKQKEDEVMLKLNTIEIDKSNEILRLQYKLEETERKLKSTQEEFKASSDQSIQEIAILTQKLEFAEQEAEELKSRKIEERRNLEAKISYLESNQAPKADQSLQKIKAEHAEEISRILKDHETEKVILKSRIEDLIDTKNEIELRLKLERNESAHREKELRDALNESLAVKSKLLLEIAGKSNVEEDPKLKLRVFELEKEVENLERKNIEEIEVLRSKNDISIAQLRTFFDQEKAKFEQKVLDEKNKYEKRLIEATEEFDEKLSNELSHYNEEIQNLNEEYVSMETYYNNEIKALNENLLLNGERISSLESYSDSLKEQLAALQASTSKDSSQLIENFNSQKLELLKKIESLSDDLSTKEKKLISNKYELEKYSNALQAKSKELEDSVQKHTKEKTELNDKNSSINEKYESLYSEHIKILNKSKRDLALAHNEIELVNRRCRELEESIQEIERKHKENIESVKEETSVFMNFNLQRVEKEKEVVERKLDEKKKNLKALESLSAKQTAALERERAVLEEKLSYSDRKRTEMEQYYQETITGLQAQISNRSSLNSNVGNSESEGLKLQVSKLEREIQAKQIGYDRDKGLWENKFNFLMQQRDYSRKELTTAQEKFDQIIEELKKKHSTDREKQENSSKTLISSLESRYNSQLTDMQTRYEQTIKELRDKNRQSERSLQLLTEELDTERRDRTNSASAFEKKLQQCMENEKKYLQELHQEKNLKEQSVSSLLEKFSKEREDWKSKITESERKIKELDQQKSQTFLQSEKERVKWTLEREEILTKYAEAQQQLNYLTKKQDDLKKEYDKLKTPRPRANRKGDAGLSFDDFKYSRAQSGRSTPTNSTTDSPRVRNLMNLGTLQRNLSKEEFKDNN